MARTRQVFRARDTVDTHKRQRSTSKVVINVPETALPANANMNEIAGSADKDLTQLEDSSQSETPINRSVAAFCRKCNGRIGEFYNSWHKVTSSYYSPALLGSYRSLLRVSDQRKQASESTELAGSIIDLTCCPSCDNYLGFVVVDTPAGRKRFRGRKFFKLQHIELRCETSSNQAITVEPEESVAPDLVASKDSESPSPTQSETFADTMELDTPLSSSHPLWSRPGQSEQRERQHLQPGESLRQSFYSTTTLPPVTVSPSPPINRSIGSMDIASITTPLHSSPQPAQSRPIHTAGSSIQKAQPEPMTNGHNDSHNKYPRDARDVHFDAIERLQTQVSQNTSALAAQARTQIEAAEIVRQIESSLRSEFQGLLRRQDQELRTMSEAVNQLMRELNDCRQTITSLAHEVHVARTENGARSSEVGQPNYQDEALELMARRIGEVTHRTTDLETLRDHVSILSGKVLRLESESSTTRQPHAQQPYAVNDPARPAHVPQTAPTLPSQTPAFQTPGRPSSNPQVALPHEKLAVSIPPESAQRYEPGAGQNGWATVNAGVKRVYDSKTNSPHQSASSAPGSPKRPKLGTGDSQDGHVQPPLETSHMLPSQIQPVAASQPPNPSGPYPAPHQGPFPGPHSTASHPHSPYSTQDVPSNQSWRSESQRMIEGRPARGRGSRGGRGPGSRGGRVRKSMQGQHHTNRTPEWEREQWSAVPDTQPSSSVYEGHSSHLVRSVPRRGGGGSAARISSLPLEHSNEWTPEIGPRTVYHNQDSPIEVKKTRSKPVRNEDGILVRKDGRPDRRSQSSAANLRKVHARKEEQQRESEAGMTPTGLHHSMSAGFDTPSPSSRASQELDVTDSVRKKHHDILGRIFPDGLDTSRKQHDYAHQVFNEDRDHTAHPRSQVPKSAKAKPQASPHVKTETQIPGNVEVEMGDAVAFTSGHASEQRQDALEKSNGQRAQDSPSTALGDTVQIPETQATDGSAAVATQSEETA